MRYLRELLLGPVTVFSNLIRYRHMLAQMVGREIKGRFAGSLGGLLWNFLHPVLMLISYLFVFVYIFKLRVSAGGDAGASAVFIMAGLFPWMIMAEGLARGTTAMIENANLIQKSYFPTEVLSAKAVISPFFSYGIAVILLMAHSVLVNGRLTTAAFLPLLLILQLLMTLGIAFINATLAVFFRDFIQLVNLAVSFWLFLTPILYPIAMLPPWARKIMYLNPVYPLTALYQSVFLEGSLGDGVLLLAAVLWSLSFFFVGSFVFTKLKCEFADWL